MQFVQDSAMQRSIHPAMVSSCGSTGRWWMNIHLPAIWRFGDVGSYIMLYPGLCVSWIYITWCSIVFFPYDYQPWGRCKKIYKNIRNMSSYIPYPHGISCLQEIYPPAINRSNGKSSAKWRFNGKIIGKWGIVHCHVWLPEGRSSCSYDFPIFSYFFLCYFPIKNLHW